MRTQSPDAIDSVARQWVPPVLDAVARHSARTPDAVALRGADGTTVSYRALADRVDQLAGALAASGTGPGDLVGVHLELGVDLVVSALAVLRAGGGYLPLDPAAPVRRLKAVVDDAEPRLVVTDPLHRRTVEALGSVPLDLDVDLDAAGWAPPRPAGPSDTAYVMYTSGSTGTPKGVIITHAALAEFLDWMCADFPFAPDSRVIVKTAATFDVSIGELFWPLVCGAELVIPDVNARHDTHLLVDGIRALRATDLFMVPSHLSALLAEPAATSCRTVRRVFVVGEQFEPALLRRLAETWPQAEVVNVYGPTEATILTLWHRCEPADAEGERVPIGTPAGRTTVRIVHPGSLDPVEAGTAGELLLGGPQLARGYHRRAELTAEKFVAGPDGPLYRTGDLVRRRPDGAIEFLGRGDRQVKVRGNRVELGDVEAAFLAEPHTRFALADLRPHPVDGSAVLVAWVLVEPGTTRRRVRDDLATRVPGYMVPDAVVLLAEIPMLSNGKLDRARLPEPFGAVREPVAAPAPNDLCAEIQDLWNQVADADIGPDEGFLASGGNSLLLLSFRARLRARGHESVEVLDLMAHPTPSALAGFLRRSPVAARAEGV